MKGLIIFTFIVLSSLSAVSQKRKLPPKGTEYAIISRPCHFENKSKKFVLLDSLDYIVFKTDSAEIIRKSSNDSLVKIIDKDNTLKSTKHIEDSILMLLFRKEILTPDFLQKAMNFEEKYITHSGDTTALKISSSARKFEIIGIQLLRYSSRLENFKRKKQLAFLIRVVPLNIPKKEYLIPNVYDFKLFLKIKSKFKESDLLNLIDNSYDWCLVFSAYEI